MKTLLATYSSSELAGWIAYLEVEEERAYHQQVNALAYVASRLFRKEDQ